MTSIEGAYLPLLAKLKTTLPLFFSEPLNSLINKEFALCSAKSIFNVVIAVLVE